MMSQFLQSSCIPWGPSRVCLGTLSLKCGVTDLWLTSGSELVLIADDNIIVYKPILCCSAQL